MEPPASYYTRFDHRLNQDQNHMNRTCCNKKKVIESISNIDELINIMFKSNSHSHTANNNGLKEKNSNSINILKNHETNIHKRPSLSKNFLNSHASSMTLADLNSTTTATVRNLNRSEQMTATAIASTTHTKALSEAASNRNNKILLLPHLIHVENKFVDTASIANSHNSTTSTTATNHFHLKSSILRKNSASLFKFTSK